MIGYLSGTVLSKRDTYCILVAGTTGVGYKITTPKETLATFSVEDNASFWIHTVVREDAFDLYGFVSEADLAFFGLLLTVSGIGPKSALGILDTASIETLQSAIINNNPSYLTSVSGMGKKTAEKIVMGLKDKMSSVGIGEAALLRADGENLEAMRALGYSAQEARDALREVPLEVTASTERLREALRYLGKANQK